jgi:hypothetical protein
MASSEYDAGVTVLHNRVVKIKAVQVRELHFENQAGGHVGLWIRKVFGSTTERDDMQVEAFQEITERLAYPLIVINNKDICSPAPLTLFSICKYRCC